MVGRMVSSMVFRQFQQWGKVYTVKGIKMIDRGVEEKLNGVRVHAHVKVLPPVHDLQIDAQTFPDRINDLQN